MRDTEQALVQASNGTEAVGFVASLPYTAYFGNVVTLFPCTLQQQA